MTTRLELLLEEVEVATATVYTKFRSWDAALDAAGRVVPGAANGQAWPE